jgi:ABC-2 type transport system permease protein
VRKFFRASLKMIYRDRQATFWAIAFPIIFTVVFGLFNFNAQAQINVALVTSDRAALAQVDPALEKVSFFKITDVASVDAGRSLVNDNKADMIVQPVATTAGSGVGAPSPGVEIKVFYGQGSNPQQVQVGLTTLSQIADSMNLQMSGMKDPAVTVTKQSISNNRVTYYDFILPGLVGMGIMNFAIGGIAVGITRFREQQILKRILATPARAGDFLGAQVLARLVLSIVQTALILGVGVFLFHATIYGNVAYLFVLALLGNLVFLNIGFAISGRSKTSDAAQGVSQAVAIPMMFFSGVFFPTTTLPWIVQKLVAFLPLTPLIQAMRKVSLAGSSLAACWPQIAALGAWIVVSLALARMSFSFADRRG